MEVRKWEGSQEKDVNGGKSGRRARPERRDSRGRAALSGGLDGRRKKANEAAALLAAFLLTSTNENQH